MAFYSQTQDTPQYDFTISQGADFQFSMAMMDRDHYKIPLDRWTFYLTIRLSPNDERVLLEYDSDSTPSIITVANSVVTVTIPRSITSTFNWRRGIFDILSKDSLGTVTRRLTGNVYVKQSLRSSPI